MHDEGAKDSRLRHDRRLRNFSQAGIFFGLRMGGAAKMPRGQRSDNGADENPGRLPAQVLGLGLNVVAAAFLFGFLGHWIGERIGAEPALTLLGGFLGAAAGFYSLYVHLVIRPQQDRDENEK
jgi:hypothetical protein